VFADGTVQFTAYRTEELVRHRGGVACEVEFVRGRGEGVMGWRVRVRVEV
jgi:hypothetical protein